MSQTVHRMSGADRRAAILDTAISLFADRGFRGVTTREIAAAVGVTEPVLYQHFPSKRDLYAAIIERKIERVGGIQEEIDRLFDEDLVAREFLQRLAALIVHWHASDPTFVRLLLQSALANHELHSLFEQKICGYQTKIAAKLSGYIERGELRSVNAQLAAYTFTSAIVHYCIDRQLFPMPTVPALEALGEMVELLFEGLRTR